MPAAMCHIEKMFLIGLDLIGNRCITNSVPDRARPDRERKHHFIATVFTTQMIVNFLMNKRDGQGPNLALRFRDSGSILSAHTSGVSTALVGCGQGM